MSSYDLCFTRDAEFSQRIQQTKAAVRLKLVHVSIPQTRQDEFVQQFLTAFVKQIGQRTTLAMIGRQWRELRSKCGLPLVPQKISLTAN